jgi:hypothetical protein
LDDDISLSEDIVTALGLDVELSSDVDLMDHIVYALKELKASREEFVQFD